MHRRQIVYLASLSLVPLVGCTALGQGDIEKSIKVDYQRNLPSECKGKLKAEVIQSTISSESPPKVRFTVMNPTEHPLRFWGTNQLPFGVATDLGSPPSLYLVPKIAYLDPVEEGKWTPEQKLAYPGRPDSAVLEPGEHVGSVLQIWDSVETEEYYLPGEYDFEVLLKRLEIESNTVMSEMNWEFSITVSESSTQQPSN